MHLTNYSINKHNSKFVFNDDADNFNIGHKRSLTAVLEVYLLKIKSTKNFINLFFFFLSY